MDQVSSSAARAVVTVASGSEPASADAVPTPGPIPQVEIDVY